MAELFKGIDVSTHQGRVDWRQVKDSGIQFALIRACFGWDNDDQIDKQFAANVAGCEAVGLPYGLWHYSYAICAEDARREAAFFLRVIKGCKPLYPVHFDFEEPFQVGGIDTKSGKTYEGYSPERQLQIIEAFLKEIEAAGYYGGIYMSASPLQRLLRYAPDRIARYDAWVAHVRTNKPAYSGAYGIWQHSWTGKVPGIEVDVDLNYAYKDYPTIVRRAGLNGWRDTASPTEPDTVPRADFEALEGKHQALQAAYKTLGGKHQALLDDLASLNQKYEA